MRPTLFEFDRLGRAQHPAYVRWVRYNGFPTLAHHQARALSSTLHYRAPRARQARILDLG